MMLLIAGLVVGIGALALGAWALFADRSRGRRRCPRCWHELLPAQSPCPECGRVIRHERETRWTRRRWRWVLAALLMLIFAGFTSTWPWFENGNWKRAIPTDVLIEIVPHVKGDWALDELSDRGNARSQTSPAPDSAWSSARWDRIVRACGRVIVDTSTTARRRNMAVACVCRAPDIAPLVPGLIAGLSSNDPSMRSICLLMLNGRRFDLFDSKDVILDAIRQMPEDSRAWVEEEIRCSIEGFESLAPVDSSPASDETPGEIAGAIERGGLPELVRRYRVWNTHSTTFTWAYTVPPDQLCVERIAVDLGQDGPSTQIVHIRDPWSIHGEAIVLQRIGNRWKFMGLIYVGNRVSPTAFSFEPLKTSHGTFLAVRTLNVAFPPNPMGAASDSDCFAAFDLCGGFPDATVQQITSGWSTASPASSGGRIADSNLATGPIRVVIRNGKEFIEFPMAFTWREPPAPGAAPGTGRVLFTHRFTMRHAWDRSQSSFKPDPASSDFSDAGFMDLVFGWPDDALRLMPGEFRTLAGGADWQRAWLAAFLASCKPGPLHDELQASLAR